jgi:hypothetical protein
MGLLTLPGIALALHGSPAAWTWVLAPALFAARRIGDLVEVLRSDLVLRTYDGFVKRPKLGLWRRRR